MELVNQAHAHFEKGDHSGAHSLLLQALQDCRAVGDTAGGAEVLHEMAYQARMRGDLNGAEPALRQAIQLRLAAGDRPGWVLSVFELGMLERARNRPIQASDMFARALYTARQIGDQKLITQCLHQMGMVHLEARDYAQAETLFAEAVEVRAHSGDMAGQAATLQQLGRLREAQDDLFAAADYYKQSLSLHERLHEAAGQVANLLRLGAIYQARGRRSEADRHLNHAIEIARHSGRQALLADSLRGQGEAFYERGDHAGAFKVLWQAHQASPDPQAHVWLSTLYNELGAESFITEAKRLGVDQATIDSVSSKAETITNNSQQPSVAQLVALRMRVGPDQFAALARQSQIPQEVVSKIEEAARSLGG